MNRWADSGPAIRCANAAPHWPPPRIASSCPMTRCCKRSSIFTNFSPFAFQHLGDRNARPRSHHLRNIFFRHFFVQQPLALRLLVKRLLRVRQFLLQLGNFAVLNLRRQIQVAGALRLLHVPVLAASNCSLMMLMALMAAFSFCHCALSLLDCSFKFASSFSNFFNRSRDAHPFPFSTPSARSPTA